MTVLVVSGLLAAVFGRHGRPHRDPWLLYAVVGFLSVRGVSILVSEDVGRSAHQSARLLPVALLFLLIAYCFHSPQHTRTLYVTFSVVTLGLASLLLWSLWSDEGISPQTRVAAVGSPLFIVPNDVVFLAVVASLPVALLCREPRSAVGGLAVLSVLASVAAACVLRSRLAILTMIASVSLAAGLLRRRLGLACGAGMVLLTLFVDGLLGFRLVAKFGRVWADEFGGIREGRITLWRAAWSMFLDAPWLGHGPHTFTYTYPDGVTVRWPHNLYLEVLAEQGVVGLVTLALVLGYSVAAAWRVQRTAEGDARILGAGACAGLLSFCWAGLFESSLLRQWVGLTLFALLGVIAQLSPSLAKTRR